MEYREHDNALGVHAIEHGVRKSRYVGTPYFAMDPAKHPGNLFDSIERGVNSCKEFLAKAGALLFVPPICPSQVPPNLPAVHDWRCH
jgi:hypothetical protein